MFASILVSAIVQP